MQTILLLVLPISVTLLYLLNWFQDARHDSREPPVVSPQIPLIGHAIGMMRKKSAYYLSLRTRYNLPIYTLALPGAKFYVINTIELIRAVQQLPKIFAFPPIEAKFAMIVCDSSKEANDILTMNMKREDGDWGYSVDFYQSMHPALGPGQGLDAMNRVMIQTIAASVDTLKPSKKGEATRIGLVEWLKHEITLATTDATYGRMNPFQEPKVEKAFWEFASDLSKILMNVLPSWTASKACRSRDIVRQAFLEYFQNKGHESGSVLVNVRYSVSMKHKIPLADIARYEVGGAFATLVNTAPALFWMVFYVFSQPAVLEDCRREITNIMTTNFKPDGTLVRIVDVSNLKSKCSTVLSTFQEVLRHVACGISVREVTEDAFLHDKFLLKKGNTIMMPTIVIHKDPELWGPDVNTFNHKRFLKNNPPADSTTKRKTITMSSFRGFGGGTTLCPGRHFATTEILAVLAMLCMRYDISPRGTWQWTAPTTASTSVGASISEPDTEIEVEVRMREGLEDGEWRFELADSDAVMAGLDDAE